MELKNISFICMVLLLSSCVVYYNTNDVRNDLNANINITKANFSNVENDYEEKIKIYESLSNDIVDVNKNPFKNITSKKSTFDEAYQKIRHKKDLLYSYQNTFEKLVDGKSQIKSNEDEWDQLKKIKNNIQSTGNEMNNLAGSYTAASNELGEAISNSGFGKIETQAFLEQLRKNIGSIESSVKDIDGKLTVYKGKLEDAYRNGKINDSIYKSRSNAVAQMKPETEKIKIAANKLSLLKTSFQETTKNRETLWLGENTKCNAIMKSIQGHVNTIKEAQEEFMRLSLLLRDQEE
tara:strand:- start:1265 stop:2143 length:879 start_codon:yes stop_codon:yes gene_type:complete